jgi:LmbE family N-acetylglucosaminyl deacetylase
MAWPPSRVDYALRHYEELAMPDVTSNDRLARFGRALVVAAHPDDVDFGAAGTVALLVEAGCEVRYLIVTDGQAGGFDRDLDRSQMPAVRRAEQVAAAATVGVTDVEFLGLTDGEVVSDLALAEQISRSIRQHTPDLVLTFSPERNYERVGVSHPDHRAVGDATLDAVYPFARNPFAFPHLLDDEGLDAHIVTDMWLMGHPSTDTYVDVTEVFDRKVAAIACHQSQLTDPAALADAMRGWLGDAARRGGLPEGRLAESFWAVQIT